MCRIVEIFRIDIGGLGGIGEDAVVVVGFLVVAILCHRISVGTVEAELSAATGHCVRLVIGDAPNTAVLITYQVEILHDHHFVSGTDSTSKISALPNHNGARLHYFLLV